MADFYTTILKTVGDYKAILKKTLSASDRATKMYELGIKRKYIGSDEVELYRLGLKIVAELKRYVDSSGIKNKKSNNVYLGAKSFLQYLEDFLSQYHIDNGEVVHIGRKASSALMNLIQLIMFSKKGLHNDDLLRVREYMDVVDLHGSKEQKRMLVNAVNVHQSSLVKYFPEGFSIRIS